MNRAKRLERVQLAQAKSNRNKLLYNDKALLHIVVNFNLLLGSYLY